MQLFICFLLVVGTYAKYYPIPVCHEHEHFTKCGTDCPVTCVNLRDPRNPKPLNCDDDVCFRGCECDEGYYRQYGRYVGECVKAEDCPPKEGYTILQSSYESSSGFDFPDSEFIIPTPATVQETPAPTVLVKDSPPTDPVKAVSTSLNVTEADSALAATSAQKTYDVCLQPPPSCEKAITRYGYFYNQTSDKCERFRYGSCTESGNSFRTKQECELTCIDAAKCSSPNSAYTTCGTACPITCKNYKKPPTICTFQCVKGCYCIEPYIADGTDDNHCVLRRNCPISV